MRNQLMLEMARALQIEGSPNLKILVALYRTAVVDRPSGSSLVSDPEVKII